MKVDMVSHTPEPEIKIARAAGISHDNDIEDNEDARELIDKLLEWGHYSPMEFSSATFEVEGVSRSFLAQVTRHRLASFMVESMRYTRQGDQWPVIPDSINQVEDEEFQLAVDQHIEGSNWLYDEALKKGVPKEDARFLLPIGSKTRLRMKSNFRHWRDIIKLRASEEAQWEIREFALKVLWKLNYIAPSVFNDLTKEKKELSFDVMMGEIE